MPVTREHPTTKLFLLDELEDMSRTSDLAERDLDVVGDWKFFLDDKDRLDLWTRRYGESGTQALAEELRRLPRRVRRD